MKITLTHKGWFGLCPVYFAGLDTEAPLIDPRHWSLAPLMWLTELLYGAYFLLATMARPDFTPEWPLMVTGPLKTPIEWERTDD